MVHVEKVISFFVYWARVGLFRSSWVIVSVAELQLDDIA